MSKPFEAFLENKFIELHPDLATDDEGYDRYEHWLSNLDVNEVIDFAEEALEKVEATKEMLIDRWGK